MPYFCSFLTLPFVHKSINYSHYFVSNLARLFLLLMTGISSLLSALAQTNPSHLSKPYTASEAAVTYFKKYVNVLNIIIKINNKVIKRADI